MSIRRDGLVLITGRQGGRCWVYAHQHTADQFGPLLEPIEALVARAEEFAEAVWLRDHGCLPDGHRAVG